MVVNVNNTRGWHATVTACDRASCDEVRGGARCVPDRHFGRPRPSKGAPHNPSRVVASQAATGGLPPSTSPTWQGVVGVELTTAARSVLVGMTAELLTVLTCWPNTVQPANALVYLRTRRARMARHAAWFYGLPRHVRWFLTGTDRVPSLLAFAVSAPTIDEKASEVWRKALASLNGLAKPGEGPAPEPSAAPAEPGQTRQPGCSGRDRRRRARGCQRENETAETATREPVITATAARACGDGPVGRCAAVAVGVRARRTRGANTQVARCVGSSAHGPRPTTTCGAQGGCAGPPTPGNEQPSQWCTTVSPRSFHPKTGRSPPSPVTCGAPTEVGPTTR
jgi:hypothetical protein